MSRTCPHCGCTEIDEDAARGDATCTGCGTVLEESTIVSEVQFAETGGGGHSLIGQFVSSDSAQPSSLAGVRGLGAQESREVTLNKGKKVIHEIASQLRINQLCSNTAFGFFKMAVSRKLTRGRVRVHVVAACLYMTCRLENTTHLLLDFSDVTQVNVFDLGRTFTFLAKALKITLPPTDPCLYVMRFSSMLKFGEREKDVVTLATRLVQRMKRDWMATGRRPTGLCGAAILIAARFHNFNRTVPDIVRVVHVGEAVVRKRLEEFGQTPSSNLTLDEFVTVDLEHEEDPPAFREARMKARMQQQRMEEMRVEELQEQMGLIEQEVESALEEKRLCKFKRGPYAKYVTGAIASDTLTAEERAQADEVIRSEILRDSELNEEDEASTSSTSAYRDYGPTLESLGIESHQPCSSASQADQGGMPSTSANDDDQSHPISKCTDVRNDSTPQHRTEEKDMDYDKGELDLDGIDEDEIETYILSPPEAALKERVWLRLNAGYLRVMDERRAARLEQEEKEKQEPQTAAKRRRVRKRQRIVAATPQEAMEKVLQEKKLSRKINYDVLRNLGAPSSSSAVPLSTDSTDIPVASPPAVGTVYSVTSEPEAKLKRNLAASGMSAPKKSPQKKSPDRKMTRRRPIKPTVNTSTAATAAKKARK